MAKRKTVEERAAAFVERRKKRYLEALEVARKAANEWLGALDASDAEITEATAMVNETIRDAARAGALDDADLLSGMIAKQVEDNRADAFEQAAGDYDPTKD